MADIFGRQDQVLMGGLSSDSMFMTWPELAAIGGGVGMLVQNLSLDYSQPIRRIFEIGPGVIPNGAGGFNPATSCDPPGGVGPVQRGCNDRTQPTYYIIGRPEGRFRMGRFVGPQIINECFIRTYGSACAPNIITLTGRAGCNAQNPGPLMSWRVNGFVISQYGFDVTAQEMVIQENLSGMFAGLNLTSNGVDPCAPQLVAG